MPLTPQEIQAARSQYGINTDSSVLDVSNSAKSSNELSGDALTSFLNDSPVNVESQKTSTDSILSRGLKAAKEAASSLKESFTKRATDIIDTTQKTSQDLYAPVKPSDITKQNIIDMFTKSEVDNKSNPASQLYNKAFAPIKNAINTVGQVAGGATDILGAGIKAGYKTVTPEHAQALIADGLHNIINIPYVPEGLQKLGEGMQAYDAWKSQNPDTAKVIENVVNVATLGVGKTAEQVAKEAATKGVEKVAPVIAKGEQAVTDTFNTAQEAIKVKNAARLAENAKRDAKQLDTLAGTIVQGKNAEDIAKAKNALATVDITGVKTYKDLAGVIDEKIRNVSAGLDNVLASKTDVKPLEDLVLKTKVGGSEVAHNFVKDALAQLDDLYTKTNDIASKEKIAQLTAKAEQEGLTIKELNDIAKLHGKDLNAFNANGQAASGLSKQAAENTRTGLKTTARELFGNSVYKEADAQLTNLLRTKSLVEGVDTAVQKLQQRVTERGWGEKIGRAVFQLTDKMTGGGLKGFIQSFVPRGEGLKIMNALDLEKALQSNLKKINKALDGKNEKDVLNKLQDIIHKNFPRDTSLTGQEAVIQEASISKYVKNPRKLLKQFITDNGKTVNTDEARKLFKDVGYKGYNSASVQEASSALAKDAWRYLLKKSAGKEALIYAGGSGTGKTSAVKNLIGKEVENAGAILDGNLSTMKSAMARIQEAVDAGATPKVVYVYRNPVDAWINGVVKRMNENKSEGGRIVPLSVFLQNHKGSYEVVKDLLKNGKIDVTLVDNSLGQGKQTLMAQGKFDKLGKTYSSDIKSKLLAETKKLLDNKTITKQQYESLIK